MLPKVPKTPEKNSKATDSESKTDKGAEKSIGLKFNAEDIKFAESLNRKRKKDKSSDSETSTKQENTELKKIKKNEHNITSLSSKLDYKCNEKNDIESNNKGKIHREAEDLFFFHNEVSTPSQDQDSKFITKEKSKEQQNKRENNCNETVDASLSTVQQTIINSQRTKIKKRDNTSESESSGQNQSVICKKTLNDRAKKKIIITKELKFKPKRRRIISSESSETIVQGEDENLEHHFQAKDNNTNVNNKFTNTVVETKAKLHISEENFNDKLNFKSASSNENKNLESDTIESVISKSDSESKVIEDDEDWNQKPKRLKSQNTQKSISKVEENLKSSESDSELVEVVSSKASNSESEKEDNIILSHKFYQKKSQKSLVRTQCEKSESDSIDVTSSKPSDSESEEVDKKVLGNEFYKKKLQEKSVSIPKSDLHKQHERAESDSIEEYSSKSSDSESETKIRNILNRKSQRRKSLDKFTATIKPEVNKKFEKSEFHSTEDDSSKPSDSKSNKADETIDNHKSQTRQSHNKSTHTSKTNIDRTQIVSESDSERIDSSKASDFESEEVNETTLNNNSQEQESQDKLCSVLKNNLDTKLSESESDSIEVASSKNSDSETEQINRNTLNYKSQRKKSQKARIKVDWEHETSESDSINVSRNKDSDSESEKINQNTLNSESDSIKIASHKDSESESEKIHQNTLNSESDSIKTASNKDSESESEKINQNTCNYNSQRRKSQSLKSKVDRQQRTSESDSVNVASSKASDSESEEIIQKTCNYNYQRRKSQRVKSKVNRKQKTRESDSKVASSKASDSESEEINQNTSNYISQRRESQDKSSSILINNLEQIESESLSSKHSESESDKVDKNASSSKSQKRNSNDKSPSKSMFSKQKRKLRNSESDTIDVVSAEISDSEPKKINENVLKLMSPRRKCDSDLKSKKSKKEKLTFLDAFLKKHVTEDKGSETSEVSDFILELEEEDCNMEEIDLDEEDDRVEIGNYTDRTSYWPTNAELAKLKSIHINLTHDAPPQHNIEKSSGTRNLSKEEKREFEKYNTLRKGTFSKNEDQIIKRNWINFCKMYNWDVNNPKPFLHMKYKNKEFFLSRRQDRMRFVQFLANGLFDRSLYSVYQRFKILYEPHKVTRYKPEEDSIILDFMRKNQTRANDTFVNSRDRKFADLALILRRTRASVWRRYQVLLKKQQKKKTRGRDSDNLSDSY